MKRRLYTLAYRPETLAAVRGGGERFTAEEHAFAEREERAAAYSSRDSLLESYLRIDAVKLAAVGVAVARIIEWDAGTVLSVGAGSCVLEYLMSKMLPSRCSVVATDFDPFLLERAQAFFPSLRIARFDMCRDDPRALRQSLGSSFDVAVFFGSAYVMDDREFVRLFGTLADAGVSRTIDFHAGFIDPRAMIAGSRLVAALRSSPLGRRAHSRPASETLGKFHGFARSRRELRRLYRAAGLDIEEEIAAGPYRYAAVLRAPGGDEGRGKD